MSQNEPASAPYIAHLTVRPSNFYLTERQVAERIGREYLVIDESPIEDVVEAAEPMLLINDILWNRMHTEIDVKTTSEDPYQSYDEMVDHIDSGKLLIYTGGSHPTYFTHSDREDRVGNIIGRGVHDYFGHYKHNVDFSFWGEFQKWHHMKDHYPETSQRLLFSEVVGQSGLAWYLDGGFSHPDYVQKPILAPQRWIDFCYDNCPIDLD